MTTIKEARLSSALKQFTGAGRGLRHEIYKMFTYTEGVFYLAMEARAYWLVDQIFGLQYENAALGKELFQLWKLTTENNIGKLTCEDGNGKEVFSLMVSTDFPMKEISLYFMDNVLLLPSEY